MSDASQDLSRFSLLDLFRLEAEGQVRQLTEGLLALETRSGDPAPLDSIMRAAHSIKGLMRHLEGVLVHDGLHVGVLDPAMLARHCIGVLR